MTTENICECGAKEIDTDKGKMILHVIGCQRVHTQNHSPIPYGSEDPKKYRNNLKVELYKIDYDNEDFLARIIDVCEFFIKKQLAKKDREIKNLRFWIAEKDGLAEKQKSEFAEFLKEYLDKLDSVSDKDVLRIKLTNQRLAQSVKEVIDNIDLELFLTDIKTKEGEKFEFSDELMELFTLFWETHLKKLIKSRLFGEKE